MKKFTICILAAVALTFLIVRCGKQAEEMKEAMEVMKDMPQKAEQLQRSANEAEARMAERRLRGDTLAMPFQKLQEFIPKSVSGYEAPKMSGQSMNMGQFSMSNAEAEYTKPGTSDNLRISFVDYNENYGMFSGLAFWLSGYSREDENGYEKTFDPGVKYVWALEKYEKQNRRAEVIYAIGWRFWLNVTAENQDNTGLVKSVAKNIDLKTLAGM